MEVSNWPPAFQFNPLRWIPEFLELGQRRLRSQARLLGWSILVGVVAGLGAIVFFTACQFVVHYTLDAVAGYQAHAPGGEPPMFGETNTPFRPWLLLIIPTIGGIVSGFIVYTLAPEAEGHGTDAAIAAYPMSSECGAWLMMASTTTWSRDSPPIVSNACRNQ